MNIYDADGSEIRAENRAKAERLAGKVNFEVRFLRTEKRTVQEVMIHRMVSDPCWFKGGKVAR